MELPLLAGRIRILGLVCREPKAEPSEELRLGCCGSLERNLESEMLANIWEI